MSLLALPFSGVVALTARAAFAADFSSMISLALDTPVRMSLAAQKFSLRSRVLRTFTLSFQMKIHRER